MGKRTRSEFYFGKRVRAERERRGWSQAEMAKLLWDNGVRPMYPTTIAKIESTDPASRRAVKIDEAIAVADLFGVSLDALVGRKGGVEDEQNHAMTVLAEEARKLIPEIATIMDRLREAYRDLEAQFDFAGLDQHIAEGHHWDFVGLSLEHQRAISMWGGRDLAITELYKVMVGLTNIVAVRSMTPVQLVEYLGRMETLLTEHAEEWRARKDIRADGPQIEYTTRKQQEDGNATDAQS